MTGILSSAEIAAMRATISDNVLPDTCNILSPSATADGQGGRTSTWGTATASVACRVDGNLGDDDLALSGQSQKAFGEWICTLPYDATIEPNWRLEHSSNTYTIVSPVRDETSWSAHVRFTMERISDG